MKTLVPTSNVRFHARRRVDASNGTVSFVLISATWKVLSMADVSSFTDILVISRGSRVKLLILLSLVVLAASLIEEPLATSKDEKESISRAALEDQEESANHHHSIEPPAINIHLPATSGGSKQESLFHRAERTIKETMSSVSSGILGEGGDSENSDIKSTGVDAAPVPSTLKKTKRDAKSSSDESDESSDEKKDDDWYNKQIKESLKETMERASGNADPSVQKSIQSAEESMVKAASGFVGRIETAFSSMIEQLHLHSPPQSEAVEAPEEASTGEVDPNAKPIDSVPVAEGKEETMYEHLKKRVTGLFGYEEEKDENSFLMSVDETLSDVTLPEDRVAL